MGPGITASILARKQQNVYNICSSSHYQSIGPVSTSDTKSPSIINVKLALLSLPHKMPYLLPLPVSETLSWLLPRSSTIPSSAVFLKLWYLHPMNRLLAKSPIKSCGEGEGQRKHTRPIFTAQAAQGSITHSLVGQVRIQHNWRYDNPIF